MSKDKKILLKFIATVIISAIVGGFFGFFAGAVQNLSVSEFLIMNFLKYGPYGYYALIGVSFLSSLYFLLKSRGIIIDIDNLDDSQFELKYKIAENYIEKLGILSTISTALVFALYISYILSIVIEPNYLQVLDPLTITMQFIIFLLYQLFISKKIVDYNKKLNPKIQGNVLDSKFLDEYLNSCDEFEKMQIYKAGFEAYRKLNGIIPLLIGGIFIIAMAIKGGILAILSLTFVWIILTLSYYTGVKKSR
ncbi:DUF3169 family protein [Anaerosphaera multitolerans]|uniref:DUF3169 family protein n=1 Tax=Anaerosphaera multitolerans TaxID=2487351 RepID=A0A437S6H2_9FIRM|nr:DUF3169 family protein [Anaerosphaera multitolerans]RVU54590.1 DUF3169 family protein [Anaerosphaera multitolerans]